MNRRPILWFVLIEALASWFIFGGAISGTQLLAPLDIAPALFSKYGFVDPASSGIPANHYTIDQLTYDLPIQTTIYRALRQGEIPWWDPYDYAGRPLLADPHINGNDPARLLLYLVLPFELAYNWTLIAHFLLTGLAMFLLLRHFGFPGWQCVLLAITYQFSAALVIQFAQVWVQATFAWYPLLWLVWDKWMSKPMWPWIGLAGILIALIFYSGSLQTNSYLGIFSAAFLLGYGGLSLASWRRGLLGLFVSCLIGFCLAAPVLLGQMELFALSVRKLHTPFNPWHFLGGLFSLAAVYPWVLGTFRTLDLSKLAGQMYPFGFALFIGSAAVFLALLGIRAQNGSALRLQKPKRTAIWLLVFYFVVVSTPLVNILYLRLGGLGALGLVILAAIALTTALEDSQQFVQQGRWILAAALATALVTNVFAFLVYPKILPRIKAKVLGQAQQHLIQAPVLRSFQVGNLPAEVSFRNPETALAIAGLILLSLLLMKPALRRHRWLWIALLVLNALPVLLYSHRFIPRQPIALWHRLLAGATDQKKALLLLRDQPTRLHDAAESSLDQLFPLGMSHLYRVRTVHGYSALPLLALSDMAPTERDNFKSQLADFSYQSGLPGSAVGQLYTNSVPGHARFQWLNASDRTFEIDESRFNTIKIRLAPGQGGTLLWSDTFYPGWRAFADGHQVNLRKREPCFSAIDIPASARELVLHYEPRPFRAGLFLAALGIIAAAATCIPALRHSRNGSSIQKPAEVPVIAE